MSVRGVSAAEDLFYCKVCTTTGPAHTHAQNYTCTVKSGQQRDIFLKVLLADFVHLFNGRSVVPYALVFPLKPGFTVFCKNGKGYLANPARVAALHILAIE